MKKGKNKDHKVDYAFFSGFMLFLGISWLLNFGPGVAMGENFLIFARDMVLILPPAFVIIGLFEIWVDRETIEKHFGSSSGFKRHIYAILLAATTVGGTFVAFPAANSLYHKGADYSSIFTYITSASLVMIPMSIMEASIIGLEFTALRIGLSLPLVVLSSIILNEFFSRGSYELPANV
ncbi:permease [Halarsenatibacter silvermanii]|uniref:Predicted permease n=1 Tax=Halarsenatibacter silvermanii TaxID=321763 RepID=A0A1G9IXT4_9FIRM|nr:permease [Halarsenatibacter silvermanii]SDL29891.1 Predicted permease [Halarsenatibacter silvermanii]